MDVGLVCDGCRTFNAMGSRACARCGEVLSLDGVSVAGATSTQTAAAGAASAKRAVPKAIADAGSQPMELPPKVCNVCGTTIKPGFRFCGSCGTPVSDEPPTGVRVAMGAKGARVQAPGSISSAVQALGRESSGKKTLFFGAMQAARAKLVLIKGDGLDGISFTLAGQDHLAGRGPDCPLLFREDPFLSPVHANFLYKEGKLHVRDEKSANGVFIRIRAPMPLRSGDTFLVGEQVLRVETTPPETAGLGPDDGGTFFYASPRRSSKMRLVQLLRGGDTGLIYRAAGDIVTLGRDGNDINFPEDSFISGRHVQVAFGGAGLMLIDTGSKNGTFLRINVESPLHHGDYVFMGQQLLRVEIV